MSKTITPDQIQQVKIAARRLQKSLPGAKLQKCQDIAAYQFLGVSSYHEAQSLAKRASEENQGELPMPDPDDRQPDAFDKSRDTYAERFGLVPDHWVGDWYYFAENGALVFEGEIVPYNFSLYGLTTTGKLLDCVLQLAKKRWPRHVVEERGISPHYQVQEFLELMNDLSEAYLGMALQEAFSPFGKTRVVDWKSAIKQRGEAALIARIAQKAEFVQRFGL